MDFNSLHFITLFFPTVFAIFAMIHHYNRKWAIRFVIFCSIYFYYLLEPEFSFVLLVIVGINYILAKLIYKYNKRIFLLTGVALDISVLFLYKYLPVWCKNSGQIFGRLVLPVGVSFISFSLMSYLIDCHRGKIKQKDNTFINFIGYIYLFPKIMQGPITRFHEYLNDVKTGKPEVFGGFVIFMIGLSKKVILCTPFGYISDKAFALNNEVTFCWAWLGAVSFTLQIYYDFSGYTDMAIGLGKMFGFQFRKNFQYPYGAKSPGEFWRRWHITLSEWFKEYIYFPLGGNRCSTKRNIFNMFVVWLLTGVWHGASINFLIWGMYWFLLLLAEKYIKRRWEFPDLLKNISTMFFMVIGWVIFKVNSLPQLCIFLKAMFHIGEINRAVYGEIISWCAWLNSYKWYYAAAIMFALPVCEWVKSKRKMQNIKGGVISLLALSVF